jgi:hypothetical protein
VTGPEYLMLALTFASLAVIVRYMWRYASTLVSWVASPPSGGEEVGGGLAPSGLNANSVVIDFSFWAGRELVYAPEYEFAAAAQVEDVPEMAQPAPVEAVVAEVAQAA